MNVKNTFAGALLIAAIACSRERAVKNTSAAADRIVEAAENVQERFDAQAPIGPGPSAQEIERERFSQEWRKLESFKAVQPAPSVSPSPTVPPTAPPPVPIQVTFVQDPLFQEKIAGVDAASIETMPVRVPIRGNVSGPSVLRAQVLLDRARYSPGIIDGRWGKNSEIAVYWFQREAGLPATGEVDEATFRAIAGLAGAPAVIRYALTPDDVKGPFTKIPEDVYEQEKLDCLCYENLTEALAERFHTSPAFLAALNPGVQIDTLPVGQELFVPNVRAPLTQNSTGSVAKLVISVEGSYLHAVDGSGRILFHAPTTLGSKYDPSPNETLKVVGIAFKPHFHYQPKLFHEVPDTDPEANLKPGPNSPVGVVWAALSKKHFGIHGTAYPESIGYASSHGCVRLSNWDANDVARQIQKGLAVEFVDTRGQAVAGEQPQATGTSSSKSGR